MPASPVVLPTHVPMTTAENAPANPPFIVRNPRRRRRPPTGPESGPAARVEEQPMRSELFSVGQLERHARTMAEWHELAPRGSRIGADFLLARLAENEKLLEEGYALVTDAA